MSDVFISYAREDADWAQTLAGRFEVGGWSVFWDRTLLAGDQFRAVVGEELATAKAVVVLWSSHSVQSGWVLDEARVGMERGILVPALIDDSNIPLGFGQIQSTPIAQPDRHGTSSSVSTLGKSLDRLINGDTGHSWATEESSFIDPTLRSSFLAAGAIASFVAAGFLYWQVVGGRSAIDVWLGFLIMVPGVFIGAHLAPLSEPRRVAVKALGVAAIVGVVSYAPPWLEVLHAVWLFSVLLPLALVVADWTDGQSLGDHS